MLAAVTGSAPAWRTALGELPIVRRGRWAVGGSASLALHGLPVDPRDLDLLVDHVAAAELVDGLRGAVVSDETRWDRGDVRAVRRALAVVHGVEIEILEGVEAVGPAGDVVVATPDLDHVDRSSVAGRSPCCHCRPSRSCSMRLATGSGQRWPPRYWVRQETAEGFRFGPLTYGKWHWV